MDDRLTECEDIYRVDLTYAFLAGIDPMHRPSTITIPAKDLEAMAAMERQYWDIKSKYYDVMIFFKKGKFYELYDVDAAIGHREFGLKLVFDCTNRGKMRLSGIPEQSFSEWARLFVFRGYKVGRVEQMKEEDESVSKWNRQKVVPRELVEVLTPGTLKDPLMLCGHGAVFIVSFYPQTDNIVDSFAVDLSRRVVYHCPCGVENDGKRSTREEEVLNEVAALLQQLRPREIIFPRSLTTSVVKEEKKSLAKRLVTWIEAEGFTVELVDASFASPSHGSVNESCNLTAARDLLAHYFRTLKMNDPESILSEAQPYTFHLSTQQLTVPRSPLNQNISCVPSILQHERRGDLGLILDASSIGNLELVGNLRDGDERGSLNQLLNRCCTNGGKRLFRSWILRPSASCRVIKARQDAVRFIAENRLNECWGETCELEGVQMAMPTLSKSEACESRTDYISATTTSICGSKRIRSSGLFGEKFGILLAVDFERNISRLADLKNDSSQVAYVDPLVQYKKHIELILSTVDGLKEMVQWAKSVYKSTAPPLLQELWADINAVAPALSSIEGCFDLRVAQSTSVIVPSPGTFPTYDKVSDRLDRVEAQLNQMLKQLQENVFGGADISFSHIGRDQFMVEVPLRAALRMNCPGFVERSRTSSCVRYTVATLEPLIEEHKRAKLDKSSALLQVLRSVATHILNYFPVLYSAAAALSYIDCLMSLASLISCGVATAYPSVQDDAAGAYILAEELWHPFLKTNSVPNTVNLSTERGRVLVLTGPNMAGKSTLMRTIAVNVIVAQMGGPVFGGSMKIAPITRIFTRIGARDASHKGQSTLYVELSETAEILRHADPWSLCLIDELGRGTSTHDGYAIAHATLSSIIRHKPLPPLLLFSTHYHSLALEQAEQEGMKPRNFQEHDVKRVQLGYMDFASSSTKEHCIPTITFLYRLVPGICTRSYGVEVALLAGIKPAIVNNAREKSLELSRWYDQQKDLIAVRRFFVGVKDELTIKKET
ncbi:MutS domain [Trypanosoma vivax]|uniref:Putative mismatch repair protein MSH8 n=1 Tax=Trypanosoma vivax (strain Y486) TaxID=1055687 RepID=G0U6T5_TRYVY|nr:MutS domain [Trypanosoma vivax]CCC51590.1 putative mismatch repair protein MSH8 [Trypanosoma vivax Y486]